MLIIDKLTASTEGKTILKEFSLTVKPGELHAIMGPNGAGKSTLAKVLAGHPSYEVEGGEVMLGGEKLLEMEPEERASLGLFMGFQYPVEVPGVSNVEFLKTALNLQRKAQGKAPLSSAQFDTLLNEKMEEIGILKDFKERNVNQGFSGGEKKRNEILQMALFAPKIAILDETDSGLDIDALKSVAEAIIKQKSKEMGLIVITHYQRLLNFLKPDFVHVMKAGRIVKSGGSELALKLEEAGYDWLEG